MLISIVVYTSNSLMYLHHPLNKLCITYYKSPFDAIKNGILNPSNRLIDKFHYRAIDFGKERERSGL
jgi:hypothetical protein